LELWRGQLLGKAIQEDTNDEFTSYPDVARECNYARTVEDSMPLNVDVPVDRVSVEELDAQVLSSEDVPTKVTRKFEKIVVRICSCLCYLLCDFLSTVGI
jgi:hypothetical protein